MTLYQDTRCLFKHGLRAPGLLLLYVYLETVVKNNLALCPIWDKMHIQEVFHVYLNKFENAVTHLFLVILSNNLFPWVSLISRNTQSSRKQFLIFNFWFETVSEDE